MHPSRDASAEASEQAQQASEASAAAVARFQRLLRIPTVSHVDDAGTEWERFEQFVGVLAECYPRVHAAMTPTRVAGYSLVLHWPGHEQGAPTVLMAHSDVVPVAGQRWESPPFEARVVGSGADAAIRARGALDDKGALVAILEAAEEALAAGHAPRHDVYLCFGHTEEVSGPGAPAMVAWLEDRGVRPALVLDEGGAIAADVFPAVTAPAALIGVSERGLVSLRLRVAEAGGHSSTPPRLPATVRLARAITRLHRRPFPIALPAPTREFLRRMGQRSSPVVRGVLGRLEVTGPVVGRALAVAGAETTAVVRTTAVATELSGSSAANVLASEARATIDIRVQVGATVAETLRHVRRAIRDDAVEIEVAAQYEPSPVSPWEGEAWRRLGAALSVSHPGVFTTPYVQLGASDSRFFTGISRHVYRFTPFEVTKGERAGLHAANERIRVDARLREIRFYRALLDAS